MDELTYQVRANVLEQVRLWRLDDAALRWTTASGEQDFPFSKITVIRLAWEPTRSNAGQYTCHVSVASGWSETIVSSSYRGFADFADQSEAYRRFVLALLRRVRDSNPACRITSGASAFKFYGNIAALAISAVLLLAVLYAVGFGGAALLGFGFAICVALPAAVFHWLAANKPRLLDLDALLQDGTAQGILPPQAGKAASPYPIDGQSGQA